jgi:hypothetical protein
VDTSVFIAVLAFGTLGAVMVLAWLSIRSLAKRRRSNVRKSTLAADAPNVTPKGVKPVDT